MFVRVRFPPAPQKINFLYICVYLIIRTMRNFINIFEFNFDAAEADAKVGRVLS